MIGLAGLAAVAFTAAPAAAGITGLYNTGVDASDVVQAAGTQDTHYALDGGPAYLYNAGPYATTADSTFISVLDGNTGVGQVSVFTLDFTITGLNLSNAMLSGEFAADNHADGYLNGFLFAHNDSFSHFTSFASSHLVAGLNTLTFDVLNDGGPMGLGVANLAITGATPLVAGVPEPATWALMLGGFALTGGALRRRGRLPVSVSA